MTEIEEKRRQTRLHFSVDVEIRTAEGILRGKTNDICTTGLRIDEVELLPLNTVCDLDLKLSSGDMTLDIKGKGKVVRHIEEEDRIGMGIQFVELDEYSQDILWRVIRYNSPVADEGGEE